MTTILNLPPCTTEEEALTGLAGIRDQFRLLELGQVMLTIEWAKHNPGAWGETQDSLHMPYDADPDWLTEFDDHPQLWQKISQQGHTFACEFALPELALALGATEYKARQLLREALILVNYLPHVWARVVAGGVDLWRARLLARDATRLNHEAITYVDRHMSATSARLTEGGRYGIIREAKLRFMPEDAAADDAAELQDRKVNIDTRADLATSGGTATLFAVLDTPDALLMENAVATGAAALKVLGSEDPLDVRRAYALADLARSACGQSSLDLSNQMKRAYWDGLGVPETQTSLYIHVNHTAMRCCKEHGCEHPTEVARVEGSRIPAGLALGVGRIKDWFGRPSTQPGPRISVRTVIDLNEDMHSEAYELPDRLREHRVAAVLTCIFPHCSKSARRCDQDHTVPFDIGGPTCSCNTAPLCRTHHRVKTHSEQYPEHPGWNVTALGGGNYRWTGPRGVVLLRTNLGTFDITGNRVSGGVPSRDRGIALDLPRVEDLVSTLLDTSTARPVYVHHRGEARRFAKLITQQWELLHTERGQAEAQRLGVAIGHDHPCEAPNPNDPGPLVQIDPDAEDLAVHMALIQHNQLSEVDRMRAARHRSAGIRLVKPTARLDLQLAGGPEVTLEPAA